MATKAGNMEMSIYFRNNCFWLSSTNVSGHDWEWLGEGKVNDGVYASYNCLKICVRKRPQKRTEATIKEGEFSRQSRMWRICYLLLEMIQ